MNLILKMLTPYDGNFYSNGINRKSINTKQILYLVLTILPSKLNKWISYLDKITVLFTGAYWHPRSITWFLKGLKVYALFTLLVTWQYVELTFAEELKNKPTTLIGKLFLLPSQLSFYNIHLFYSVSVLFVVYALLKKSSYFINVIFFWLVLNFVYIRFQGLNGSDYVLLALSFWSILLAQRPAFRNVYLNVMQIAFYNAMVIVIQVQVAMIYLI